MNAFEKARESYKDRNYLYLFPSAHGTYFAVNYHAINAELNSFLSLFNTCGVLGGEHKLSEDDNHFEVWFEVEEEFYALAMESSVFRKAIEKMGVLITIEYPFEKRRDTWATDWTDGPDVVANYRARWSFFTEE